MEVKKSPKADLEKKGNGYSLCKTPVACLFCNMLKTVS